MFLFVPLIFIILGSCISITAYIYKKTSNNTNTSKKIRKRQLDDTDQNLQKILPNLLPDDEVDYFDKYKPEHMIYSGIFCAMWGFMLLAMYLKGWIEDK